MGTRQEPSARRWSARLGSLNPGELLDRDTLAVGAGLVVSGASAYVFLVMTARVLGPERYAPLAVAWALIFLAATGLFLPIEQETTRAIVARATASGRPELVTRRAWLLTAAFAGGAVVLAVVTAPISVAALLDDTWLLFLGVVLALVGYSLGHLVRGVEAGHRDFAGYAIYIGGDGVIRAALALALVAAGVNVAGPYGLVIGIAAVVTAVAAIGRRPDRYRPRPPHPDEPRWQDLGASLGALLAGSALAQALANAGPLALEIIADDDEAERVGQFFAALIVARVPLFLFQAVQVALLARLSTLVAEHRYREFRSATFALVRQLVMLGSVGSAGMWLLGPTVIRLLFGADFALGRRDVALLAAATMLHILGIALAQSLVALASQVRMAAAWAAGLATFVVALIPSRGDLLLRVEVALVLGESVVVVTLALATWASAARAARRHADLQSQPRVDIER